MAAVIEVSITAGIPNIRLYHLVVSDHGTNQIVFDYNNIDMGAPGNPFSFVDLVLPEGENVDIRVSAVAETGNTVYSGEGPSSQANYTVPTNTPPVLPAPPTPGDLIVSFERFQ